MSSGGGGEDDFLHLNEQGNVETHILLKRPRGKAVKRGFSFFSRLDYRISPSREFPSLNQRQQVKLLLMYIRRIPVCMIISPTDYLSIFIQNGRHRRDRPRK